MNNNAGIHIPRRRGAKSAQDLFIGAEPELTIEELDINSIKPNRLNTAPMVNLEELKALIKKNGSFPLTVYQEEPNQYILISGERRYRAALELGFQTLQAVIVDKPENELDERILINLWNVQRPDEAETMKEKINSWKTIADLKRDRGDEDIQGIRTTEFISAQLGGLSPRTVQEYLTGKYSDQYQEEIQNREDELETKKEINHQKELQKRIKQIEKAYEYLVDNIEHIDQVDMAVIKRWGDSLQALEDIHYDTLTDVEGNKFKQLSITK